MKHRQKAACSYRVRQTNTLLLVDVVANLGKISLPFVTSQPLFLTSDGWMVLHPETRFGVGQSDFCSQAPKQMDDQSASGRCDCPPAAAQ